jgi:hypothetical protein
MICSYFIAITRYIDALFLCNELNLLGTGEERWQLKFLLRNVSPFYWEEQCSELNPYCTVETNFQHRFCVNVLYSDLIGPFIFEFPRTADMFLQFPQNGLSHLFQ